MIITFLRTLIIYLAISVSMRLMGKRQLGELEPSELAVAVLISDITSHPLESIGTPLLYGLIPIFTLVCCEVLISGLSIRSIAFRRFISGVPSVIIDKGKINQYEMKKNRITLDELMAVLRKNGITDIAQVRHGILETDGTLSILPNTADSPATPSQMGLNVANEECPLITICDGSVISANLRLLGRDEKWLNKQLQSRGIPSPERVFLMLCDSGGRVYIAEKEGKR